MKKGGEKIPFLERLFARPWIIVMLAAFAAVTVFFALQLPRAKLDNNNFSFVPREDEARKTSAEIDEMFDSSSIFVLVGLKRTGGEIFDAEFLSLLNEYVTRIADIDIVDSINSMATSDYISGEDGNVSVDKLLPEDFAGTPEEAAELKRRLLSWDMYKRALVSDDYRATQVLVSLRLSAEDAGNDEAIDGFIKIRDLAREMFAGEAEVYVTGLPVISATVNEAVRADLKLLVPLVVVVVLCILFFSFRRLAGVLLPLVSVAVAAIWSMGAMPLFGIKLSVISTVLPVILVAVGSAYGIHVITHYIDERGAGPMSRAEHSALIISQVRRIGKAVFLAAITTFVGFSSFVFTSVIPIREFGFFSSFGVLVSYLMAVTLIPALLILRGPLRVRARAKKANGTSGAAFDEHIAGLFLRISSKRKTVLIAAALITVLAVYGVTKIVIDNVFIEYFEDDTDIVRSDRFIREQFGGSKVISVVAEAEDTAALLSPACLQAVDGLARHLEAEVPEVGKVMGFTDLIKRVNEVWYSGEGKDSASYYEIPADPSRYGFETEAELTDMITGYLMLLTGDIGAYANDRYEPTAIKMTVQLRTLGGADTDRAVNAINAYIREYFPPGIKTRVGGTALVEKSLNRLVVESQLVSVLISILAVFLIVALSNKSFIAGLAGVVPLSVSILINFAVMGFLGIKLNIGTSMVASVSVGIGIDYTIHYLEAFKREFALAGGSWDNAVFLRRTFTTSGKAIIINALSVGAGFAVLLFSKFIMLRDLGLLIALTMLVSALASLTVIPVLLLVLKPRFIERRPL
jgi:hydrophobe/amphiphile efflux-3 (HAE3) family protein